MKYVLTSILMTSHRRAFPAFLLATFSSTLIGLLTPAFADDAAAIRDHVNRGNVLLSRRQFQEAINEYEEVLKLDPNYSIAKNNIALTHNNWGIYLYSMRKYAEAKEHWETSLKLNPRDGNVVRNLKIVENQLLRNPPPAAPDNNPKPTGPQDWSPFDESLDKIPKNSKANSGQEAPPTTPPPPTVTVPGQQQAQLDTSNTSGPVVILGSSSGSSSATTNSVGSNSTVGNTGGFNVVNQTPPANSGTIRILGGNSGGASIIGSGAAPSANAIQTTGTAYSNITTGNTTGTVRVPVGSSPKSSGGSVPMSWPGAEDNTDEGETPSFLKRAEDNKPEANSTESADSSANIEEQLAKIENKVYGKVSKNMPILKRIEKLEVDTMGKKKSGSVADRLKELKDTYGI